MQRLRSVLLTYDFWQFLAPKGDPWELHADPAEPAAEAPRGFLEGRVLAWAGKGDRHSVRLLAMPGARLSSPASPLVLSPLCAGDGALKRQRGLQPLLAFHLQACRQPVIRVARRDFSGLLI